MRHPRPHVLTIKALQQDPFILGYARPITPLLALSPPHRRRLPRTIRVSVLYPYKRFIRYGTAIREA